MQGSLRHIVERAHQFERERLRGTPELCPNDQIHKVLKMELRDAIAEMIGHNAVMQDRPRTARELRHRGQCLVVQGWLLVLLRARTGSTRKPATVVVRPRISIVLRVLRSAFACVSMSVFLYSLSVRSGHRFRRQF